MTATRALQMTARRDDVERLDATSAAFQRIVDRDGRSDYAVELAGLHDALVRSAAWIDEHDPDRSSLKTNEVNRRRFVAHQLTVALRALAEYDARYPSQTTTGRRGDGR